MKLTYTKIAAKLYKFFYEEGKRYGEFYIRLEPEAGSFGGNASLEMKDPDYGHDLIQALAKELCPTTKVSKKQFMLDRRLEAQGYN
jgi:hypothetical protein